MEKNHMQSTSQGCFRSDPCISEEVRKPSNPSTSDLFHNHLVSDYKTQWNNKHNHIKSTPVYFSMLWPMEGRKTARQKARASTVLLSLHPMKQVSVIPRCGPFQKHLYHRNVEAKMPVYQGATGLGGKVKAICFILPWSKSWVRCKSGGQRPGWRLKHHTLGNQGSMERENPITCLFACLL